MRLCRVEELHSRCGLIVMKAVFPRHDLRVVGAPPALILCRGPWPSGDLMLLLRPWRRVLNSFVFQVECDSRAQKHDERTICIATHPKFFLSFSATRTQRQRARAVTLPSRQPRPSTCCSRVQQFEEHCLASQPSVTMADLLASTHTYGSCLGSQFHHRIRPVGR